MSGVQKEKEPLRVLHVFGRLNLGGAESRTVELYRAMDRNQVQFDFLVHTDAKGVDTSSDALMKARAPEHFDKTVRELGARIFAVPRFRGSNFFAYQKTLRCLFEEHRGEWAAVHGHMTSTAAIYLKIAGESDVPLLIAHARSAGVDPGLKGKVTDFLRRPLRRADCPYFRFAVSKTAGEAVFGEAAVRSGDVNVIPNGIRLDRFSHDAMLRERIRAQYGIPESAVVIGHVGNFRFAKNHEHLIRMFACFRKFGVGRSDCPEDMGTSGHREARLLLVGDGERMQEMRTLATQEAVAEDVIFAGKQADIAPYLQAMDAFVFPSRYEGMPGAVLEAQAAGLPCLVSDAVTEEVMLTPLVSRMSLTETPEHWAKVLEGVLFRTGKEDPAGTESVGQTRETACAEAKKILRNAGFDIKTQAEQMTAFYLTGILPRTE